MGYLPMRKLVLGAPRDSLTLQKFPFTSCLGYWTGSEGKSPRWDTDDKNNTTYSPFGICYTHIQGVTR